MTNNQQKYITDNSSSMYITDISKELKLSYDRVYNYIKRKGLKQKKVQPRKAKVVNGYFNYDKSWII